MKYIPFPIVIIAVFLWGADLKNDGLINSGHPLRELLDSLNIEKKDLSILVDKSDYRLSILAEEKILKEYYVVFGGNPVDDKLREGDRCTPEGDFKVRDFYPHGKWSKFIWIDYPNEGSWKKHSIAKENGTIPKDAKIGGEIGIHGVSTGYDDAISNKINWTLGCISLKNDDVNEIYPYVFKGMSVKIRK